MTFLSLNGAASKLGIGPPPAVDWAAAQRNDLRLVSRGDWVRLCNADEAGGDALPYSPSFLASFEKECCYDRYFPSDVTTSAVRYLFAGYHFAVVGSGGFFEDTAVHHFRRHYFQMALLVNMELASLLVVSSRISDAVGLIDQDVSRLWRKARSTGTQEAFRHNLRQIQRDFLNFVHRYRSTSVSNQIQPSELYGRWRDSLRLDDLFDDVKGELDAAFQFNTGEDQLGLAQAGTRLAGVAALLGSVGLGLTFLQVGNTFSGLLVRIKTHTFSVRSGIEAGIPAAIIITWTLLIAIAFGYGAVRTLFRQDDAESRSVRQVFHWPLAICAVAAVTLMLLRLAHLL